MTPARSRTQAPDDPVARNEAWMARQGWRPFDFQREIWDAMARGESGLLHATTGAGKTYAVWLGALAAYAPGGASKPPPLTVLWLTPMRALAADTAQALARPLADFGCAWTVGVRTGDTPSTVRAAQDRTLPTALVTTPESLSLLLSRSNAHELLGRVRAVVVDEWHELLGNKRGVQAQLALARLRRWNPGLCTWGLSATLGNPREAMAVLLGEDGHDGADAGARLPPRAGADAPGLLVRGALPKALIIDTLLPPDPLRFPWAGHLGMSMLPAVCAEIEASATTLVFVNTRAQAELWYQALLDARPEWAGVLALHHGSLDSQTRAWVEAGLKDGLLKAVVCTSSLDLGVDFLPVERVLQIGSPKGVARLLQRAGRSGHAPGRPSRVTLVPTHSLELVEACAARAAAEAGRIEARDPPDRPLDVLVQHLVTIALGGGFRPDDLYAEVRRTHAYRHLSPDEWQWALDFVASGGRSLGAYPDYRRVAPDGAGVWRVPDARLARRHRMSIGTIVADAAMQVRYWSGRGGGARLGTVEEGFIARLRPGDCFLFAGRLLELVRVHEMTAYVRRAQGRRPAVPRWNGGRMPLSSELADAVVEQFALAAQGRYESPELARAEPMLALQARWSALPRPGVLLAETLRSREGSHLFLYPFGGRHVHLGVASLIAWRVARRAPATFTLAVNDYGLELLCPEPQDWPALFAEAAPGLLEEGDLLEDVLASLNAAELAQRRFREIARVSGLVFQGFPGAHKSARQLQASSSLFYQVFREYDPRNLLLTQAEREVLAQELELRRLRQVLARMRSSRLQWQPLARATPLSFPLMVERLREKLSTEKLAERVARMLADLEKAADAPPVAEAGRKRNVRRKA
ncbi:DNA ligase-associated DEXH box helicase [Bordetella genomosp. 10]|uniref:DNA ligase-associated DEXH box helicase n=1 Tax=Bordetella genomosp. 10 TaxID=1416804 RepID=A0A261SB55_9BORD|nr:DNA ligase-associated DEXH box helicase [Bordetella genomosp. 10]